MKPRESALAPRKRPRRTSTTSRSSVALFPLLLLVSLLISTTAACPNAVRSVCNCFEENGTGQIIECHGQTAEALVQVLTQHQDQIGLIKSLAIVDAPAIGNLTADFFHDLYIKQLSVKNSGVRFVDAKAFRKQASTLMALDLSNNKIARMPADAVNGMKSLVLLNLANNSVGALDAPAKLPPLPKVSNNTISKYSA